MNGKVTITVVVPVYMVEEYLADCINSILAQSYKDFELLLVDDGSTDRSGKICDEYATKDSRIKVIHKENGGLSDARNTGIELATGEYITFIDSDDIVSNDYLKCLYDAAIKYNADIVQGVLTTFYSRMDSNSLDRRNHEYNVRVFDKRNAIRDYLIYRTHFSNSTVKLFNISLFDDIRFPIGKYSEDEYTTYRLVLKANRTVCLPRYIYYYRLRQGSIVRSYSEKRFEVCDEVPELIHKALEKQGYSLVPELNYKNMRLQFKIYNDFVQGGQYIEYRKSLQRLESRIKAIPVNRKIWQKRYVIMKLMITYFPHLYRFIVFQRRGSLRGNG